jgi:uncharacterized membrane protein
MWPPDLLTNHTVVVLIDFIGGLLLVASVVAAVVALLRTGCVTEARLLVAEGAVLGLSFKTAGTLLRTLDLRTWEQILMFGVVLTLRVVLKQLFVWEKGRVQRTDAAGSQT